MSQFNDKVVLVTGAAGALGAAEVEHFAAAGATVTQLDLAPIDNAHWSATCDLTSAEATARAVGDVLAALGRIDVLANIAGGFTMGDPVHGTSAETWDFMFNLNARSVFNTAQAVVPVMLKAGQGRIISVGAN